MSTSYSPVNVSGGVSTQTTINQNLTDIQTALSRQLNRYGDTGTGSNIMLVDLDMNSNDILNAGTVYAADIVIAGVSLMTSVNAAAASAAAALASQIAAAASAANAVTSANNANNSALAAAASAASIVSFSNIAVATQSTVVADLATDTLTLVAGSGIGITTNAGADTITFTNTATPISTFLGLTDTPSSFTAKKLLRVNSTATALEYVGLMDSTNKNTVLGGGTAGALLNPGGGGTSNTLIGEDTGNDVTTGANNTLGGYNCGNNLASGSRNAAWGSNIVINTSAAGCVAIGDNINMNAAALTGAIAIGKDNGQSTSNYDFTVASYSRQIIQSNMDTGIFRITGQLQHTTVHQVATYTAAKENVITCDASSGAFSINLPPVATSAHRTYTIKKIDATANAVTVDGNAAETIDGATTFSLSTQYDFVTVQCNAAGTTWSIIGRNSIPAAPAVNYALAYRSTSDQTISVATNTTVAFNNEEADTGTIHDNVTNNDRLVVPIGATLVKLTANLKILSLADATQLTDVYIAKNALGNGYNGCARIEFTATQGSGGITIINLSSPILSVTGGDYFTVNIFTNDTSGCSIANDFSSWFSMEIVA